MEQIYGVNGLLFWSEREIRLRQMMREHFAAEMTVALRQVNAAWQVTEIEAPLLTPRAAINPNYTDDDVWTQVGRDLVLRPETTPGSYAYACHMIQHEVFRPPTCVWQAGKSFRHEQDQVTKNMRLKEFHQQEFQCIYAADTANDYMEALAPRVKSMIAEIVGLPSRLAESDRLPSYSRRTVDVEVDNGDKWMEVCSMSTRLDFPMKAQIFTKKGVIKKDLLVFEVAIGLDRCVYNFEQRAAR